MKFLLLLLAAGVTAAPAKAQEIVTLQTRPGVTQSFFIANMGGLKAEDEKEVEAADGTKTQQKVTKHLFVLITPTIIDPAGNRVHSEEDIAKQQGTARP